MIGSTLNSKWIVDKQISVSGQSTTYLAHSNTASSDYQVVIKAFNERQLEERAIQEIMVLSKHPHPNIVKYVDSDVTSGPIWLATEYYKAGNLSQNPTKYPGDFATIARRYLDVLTGLSYLHAQDPPITHRDIKPENFLLNDPNSAVVISDFGICYLPGSERFTRTNEPVGARNFMAPEHEIGRWAQIDPQSDVYSLGKLLYWMLSGETLWREEFRSKQYNLVEMFSAPELEHFNNLFDRMICVDQKTRLKNAREVLQEFQETVRLISGNYNPTNWSIDQKCQYCGIGFYKNERQVHPFSASQQKVMTCDNCGHSQVFKLLSEVRPGQSPYFPGWRS